MQKKYRLTNSSFRYLYRKGKSVSEKLLVLIFAPSKYGIRAGFVVSKKVGKAVVRNKTRRRMRESFRTMIPVLGEGVGFIWIARQPAADADYQEIRAAMRRLLIRSGYLKERAAGE